MKKLTLISMILGIALLSACKPNYDELILGQWDVYTLHDVFNNLTDSIHHEKTYYPQTDSLYPGCDAAEFKSDGTVRLHMSAFYVAQNRTENPYRSYQWRIIGDTLYLSQDYNNSIVYPYAIQELNDETLVIEYYNKTSTGFLYDNNDDSTQVIYETIQTYTLQHAQN